MPSNNGGKSYASFSTFSNSIIRRAASAALQGDRSFKTLGARRSLDVVAELARRVVGP